MREPEIRSCLSMTRCRIIPFLHPNMLNDSHRFKARIRCDQDVVRDRDSMVKIADSSGHDDSEHWLERPATSRNRIMNSRAATEEGIRTIAGSHATARGQISHTSATASLVRNRDTSRRTRG